MVPLKLVDGTDRRLGIAVAHPGAGESAGARAAVGTGAAGGGSDATGGGAWCANRSWSCSSASRLLSARTPLLKLPWAVNLHRKSSGGPQLNR